MSQCTLDQLPLGQTAKIIRLTDTAAPFRRKLLAMGILPGTLVTAIRVAPLGDPVEVNVRGYELSLRKADAEMIEVE